MSEIDPALLAFVIGGVGGAARTKQLQTLVTQLRMLNGKLSQQPSEPPPPSAELAAMPRMQSGTALASIPAQLGTIGAPRG
jgi:hypothetical protein